MCLSHGGDMSNASLATLEHPTHLLAMRQAHEPVAHGAAIHVMPRARTLRRRRHNGTRRLAQVPRWHFGPGRNAIFEISICGPARFSRPAAADAANSAPNGRPTSQQNRGPPPYLRASSPPGRPRRAGRRRRRRRHQTCRRNQTGTVTKERTGVGRRPALAIFNRECSTAGSTWALATTASSASSRATSTTRGAMEEWRRK